MRNVMSRTTLMAAIVAASALALAACGSTSFKSTWSAPDAGPLQIEDGTKVLAMVISPQTAKQRGMEAALVNELNEHDLEGIASYSVVPASLAQDAEKAAPYVKKSGASYAVVVQITGSDKQITGTPSMMGRGMWGAPRGFYGARWGWGYGWGGGTDIRTDTIVGVQTLLYHHEADKLVWAGQSQTMNPSRAESFMSELMRSVGNELQKEGLVGPAS